MPIHGAHKNNRKNWLSCPHLPTGKGTWIFWICHHEITKYVLLYGEKNILPLYRIFQKSSHIKVLPSPSCPAILLRSENCTFTLHHTIRFPLWGLMCYSDTTEPFIKVSMTQTRWKKIVVILNVYACLYTTETGSSCWIYFHSGGIYSKNNPISAD